MDFKSGITLIFFCGMSIFTFTYCSDCNFNIAVGDSVTVPSAVDSEGTTFEISWKHDKTFVIKNNKLAPNIVNFKLNLNGSLEIQNAKLDNSGKYVVEVFDDKGDSKGTHDKTVCVYEKFPNPKVNFTCKENEVVVECEKPRKDVTIKWYKSQKIIEEEKGSQITKKDLTAKYKCEWHNPVHTADSAEVGCQLGPTSGGKDTLFGFDRWIMIAILAGGGGLVLLLVIVLLTCACRSCKRREKHILDQEELRLNFSTPPQRSKHTARGQPAPPVPQEDPEVSNYEVDDPPPKAQTRTKNQHRVRPPPPPMNDDEDEQPPPLPQPRKKAPHAKKNQAEESRARPLYMQP